MVKTITHRAYYTNNEQNVNLIDKKGAMSQPDMAALV